MLICDARHCWPTCLCLGLAAALAWCLAAVDRAASGRAANPPASGHLDPAAWGTDHVGQPVPEFVSGDECLFCHRRKVGATWSQNAHATTIRRAELAPDAIKALQNHPDFAGLAAHVQLVLGHDKQIRFLKRLPAYGKLSLLSVGYQPRAPGPRQPDAGSAGRLTSAHNPPRWNDSAFAERCAGCHATGVDPASGAFSAVSLDCFACHGDASLEHTNDASLIYLAAQRRDPAQVVISICAQCHLRVGSSRSTGRPFANNFVAGDNLFRDLDVDFRADTIAQLNPADRHVLENVRDVVLRGRQEMTCLSCHDVHQSSTAKHYEVPESAICLNCHAADQPKSVLKQYEVHSRLCGY